MEEVQIDKEELENETDRQGEPLKWFPTKEILLLTDSPDD